MGPEKGTTPGNDRWRAHRFAALLLRAAIFLVPLAVGFVVGRSVARALPETETAADIAVWWVTVIAASTFAATLTDRAARRLLPLTILLRMTMLFPDRAPSRMRVALRSGNFTELRKRISRAQSGEDRDIGEMSELILSLATALSQHDRKTRGHSERTRAYTDIIAEEMGLSEEARDKLRWAALLHDVGKLEVPAEILNKDSKLTDEEWHLVRQHPVYGMKLVAPLIPWLGEWSKTIEHHHERFDGTGYPHGLAGSDISLGARIVSVGDAYDVMTSGRTYQRAKTPAAARQEIARMSGSQFDPVVVRALMNVSLGRLRVATGPLAMLAELPFIRGLPQVGRDAATLLTSSAVMATSLAAGVIPPPASLLPDEMVQAVVSAGDFALPVPETATPGGRPDVDAPASPTPSPQPDPDTTSTTAPPASTTTTLTEPPPPPTAVVPGSPRAAADSAVTEQGVPITIRVLANDVDPGAGLDPSTLRLVTKPRLGTGSISNGAVRYLPAFDRYGEDAFRYRVCNVDGQCAEADVTVTITPANRPPEIATVSGSVDEDGTLDLPLVVSDADGDAVSCRLGSSPPVGAATVPADCSYLVFQPPADFNGTVDIAVVADDGSSSTERSIRVEVTPVNDRPVATDDTATGTWSAPVTVDVLSNDRDPDGDPLTVSIVLAPSAGSATVSGASVVYTPAFGSAGTFSIGYRICDPSGACADATASVTVSAVTIANDDAASTTEGTRVIIRAVANDVPASGTWSRASFRIIEDPANGSAQVLGGGRIRYTPDRGFTGVDTLRYELCDNQGLCDTATVTFTVR